MKICLVEDRQEFIDLVEEIVTRMGHVLTVCRNANAAFSLPQNPDLYILDVGLPDGSGLDICKTIRKVNQTVPILILTILGDEQDVIAGFKAGADDYIVKPFSVPIFMARVSALLRRSALDDPAGRLIKSGDLSIDTDLLQLKKGAEQIRLFPAEWKILNILLANNGALVRRDTLLEVFWDSREKFVSDNTLSVHIGRLRKKLGTYHGTSYIKTETCWGYRWNVEIKHG